jgi:UDP-N-acetylmuramoyl-L-alanyl-D-glutamate--2,6-diaminopimelate ligase
MRHAIQSLCTAFEHEIYGNASDELCVSGLSDDSREVAAGDLFLIQSGASVSGELFVEQAKQKGAVAIVTDHRVETDLPQIVVTDIEAVKSALLTALYPQSSKINLIGITGTDGKTSVAQMLAQAIATVEGDCGLSGTITIGTIKHPEMARLTTPSRVAVTRWLHQCAEKGCSFAVMEVSSHALAQGRVRGLRFVAVALTNLGRDHLDYHKTIAAYKQAKFSLLTEMKPKAVVLNLSQDVGREALELLSRDLVWGVFHADVEAVFSKSISSNDIEVSYAEFTDRLNINFSIEQEIVEFSLPLVGEFQSQNVATVFQLMRALNFDLTMIKAGIQAIKPIAGRMEMVEHSQLGPLVVIDYSHTAQAIENALLALRPVAEKRAGALSVVFGCGGDRDKGKRSEMASAAEKNADVVILTSDNPRSENPEQILVDAQQGFEKPEQHLQMVDREEAIVHSIKEASKADVILIAGKGHETYQEINGQRYPFSDYDKAQSALKEFWR